MVGVAVGFGVDGEGAGDCGFAMGEVVVAGLVVGVVEVLADFLCALVVELEVVGFEAVGVFAPLCLAVSGLEGDEEVFACAQKFLAFAVRWRSEDMGESSAVPGGNGQRGPSASTPHPFLRRS